MAWIESHQELRNHPKIKRMANRLHISTAAAVGHIHFLWWWAMDYAPYGDITDFDAFEITDAAGFDTERADEFRNVLIDVGFIDNDENGLFLHDWLEYSGGKVEQKEAEEEKKAKNRERQRRYREKKNAERNADITQDVTQYNTLRNAGVTCDSNAGVTDDVTPCNAPTIHNNTIHNITLQKGSIESSKSANADPAEPDPDSDSFEQAGKHISYKSVVELYHDICKSFPKVQVLNQTRKKAIKARFKSGYSIDDFEKLFTKAESSDFMKGKNPRNWVPNFDWMITDSHMASILEGKYDKIFSDDARGQPSGRGILNNERSTDFKYDFSAFEI